MCKEKDGKEIVCFGIFCFWICQTIWSIMCVKGPRMRYEYQPGPKMERGGNFHQNWFERDFRVHLKVRISCYWNLFKRLEILPV